ncbi:MAG: GIY-YIG nuclease family protein [Candidatus Marinimicrobia bacterium]|nr:GIY-YIG nuclease family protein [Candidatus Neomarinimicrobiota bacterium]
MHYVYCLENAEKQYLYIGSTNQLKQRIEKHKKGECKATKPYMPLILTAYVAVNSESKARKLEAYFKTGSGKAILKKRILQNEVTRSGT